MKEEKSLKKVKDNSKKSEKIQSFKKKWLIKGTTTFLLIAILIAIFVLINFGMKKWDPTPIDCTKSQDYSLTEESKNRIKDIGKDVNIYFVGFEENNKQYELVKQYNKVNSKIKVKTLDASKDIQLAKQYNLTTESQCVVIECGKTSRTIEAYDLQTYDSNYVAVDVTEQKLTSAILNVVAEKIPKVYFLEGYTEFSLDTSLASLAKYLQDEVLTYEKLNILNKKEVPNDCDTLIITTPNKDFDDLTTDAIIKYINKGGNILWFNGIYDKDVNFKNVNKVLSQYGVKGFEKGIVYETNTDKIFGQVTCFAPEIGETDVLKGIKNGAAVLLFATKINVDEEKLESLKVVKNDLMTSSEKSYFTKNLTLEFNSKNDEKGSFIVGAEFEKTIKEAKDATEDSEAQEAVKSELIIYGNDYFISDYPIEIASGYQQTVFSLLNNADVVLNSIAHLTNNDQDITIRKSHTDSQTSFTPSERAKTIIIAIIFAVPVIIIIAGIVVWNIRRRRN